MICERLRGGSILDCECMVEGGGWLECPPPLRRPLPKLDEVLEALPIPVRPVSLGRDLITAAEFRAIAEAELRNLDLVINGTTNADPTPPGRLNVEYWRSPKPQGVEPFKSNGITPPKTQVSAVMTGEFCREPGCGGFMVRTGSCMTCQSCGFNEGCG